MEEFQKWESSPQHDPNVLDEGFTSHSALSMAINLNSTEILGHLLRDAKLDPNRPATLERKTPLLLACEEGRAEVVHTLLSLDELDPAAVITNLTGVTMAPLEAAIVFRKWDAACELLADHRVRPTVGDVAAACLLGDLVALRAALASGRVDVNQPVHGGWTPLHIACLRQDTELARLLLANPGLEMRKSKSSVGAWTGLTPFHLCCKALSLDLTKLLLHDARVDVNEPLPDGDSPLHLFARNTASHPELLALFLLHRGVDVNRRTAGGTTALHLALSNKGEEFTSQFLSLRFDVTATDQNGMTVLHTACESGAVRAVARLLAEPGVDVNAQTSPRNRRRTPFFVACVSGMIEVARLLFQDLRVDVNMVDDSCTTPLLLACYKGHAGLIDLLQHRGTIAVMENLKCQSAMLRQALRHIPRRIIAGLINNYPRVDINQADQNGNTLLHFACEESCLEFVDLLLQDTRLQVNQCNNILRQSAIHLACVRQDLPIVLALLRSPDLNVNQEDGQRQTPISIALNFSRDMSLLTVLLKDDRIDATLAFLADLEAVREVICGCPRAIKTLIDKVDVDINKPDEMGNSILHLACETQRPDAVMLLLKDHHIDVNRRNVRGSTALQIAARNHSNNESAKYLIRHPQTQIVKGFTVELCVVVTACLKGNLELLRVLLADPRVNLDQQVDIRQRCVDIACRNKNLELLQIILAHCSRINVSRIRPMDESIKSLILMHKKDPKKTRASLQFDLGITVQHSAELFAMVVFLSDDYLTIRKSATASPQYKFFSIAKRLPLELQMVLCNRVCGLCSLKDEIIPHNPKEAALQKVGYRFFAEEVFGPVEIVVCDQVQEQEEDPRALWEVMTYHHEAAWMWHMAGGGHDFPEHLADFHEGNPHPIVEWE